MSKHPPQILPPNYWELQLRLVTLLSFIGLEHKANERLDLFRIRWEARKRSDVADQLLIADILILIDELVELRTSGQEPPHEDGRYI